MIEQTIRIAPADRRHISVDVGAHFGTKVDVIRMLVHIEREDWRTASESVAVIRCPLVDEFAISGRPGKQHPTRATTERLPHRDKFRTPTLIRPKVGGERIAQSRSW